MLPSRLGKAGGVWARAHLLAVALRDGAATIVDNPDLRGTIVTAAGALSAALAFTPANCGRAHRWLGSLGKGASAQQEAAAVAALIGGGKGGLAAAMRTAHDSFLVLPLASLSVDDLASNADTGLNKRVRHAALGECDAFMSHSWCVAGSKLLVPPHCG